MYRRPPLFYFAKKSISKEGDAGIAAFGFPIVQGKKWESQKLKLGNVRLQRTPFLQVRRMRLEFPLHLKHLTLFFPIFAQHNRRRLHAVRANTDKL